DPADRHPVPAADPADRLPGAVRRRTRAGCPGPQPPAPRSPADEERHAPGPAATRRPGMTGPIALHGGGEFQPGDTPFLRRLLELAMASRRRASAEEPIRIAI